MTDPRFVIAGLCLEKRVFYRMISGFHTSINVDVVAHWLMPGEWILSYFSLVPGLCLEHRTFFNIISGMHTSINTHLSAKYPKEGKNSSKFEISVLILKILTLFK